MQKPKTRKNELTGSWERVYCPHSVEPVELVKRGQAGNVMLCRHRDETCRTEADGQHTFRRRLLMTDSQDWIDTILRPCKNRFRRRDRPRRRSRAHHQIRAKGDMASDWRQYLNKTSRKRESRRLEPATLVHLHQGSCWDEYSRSRQLSRTDRQWKGSTHSQRY